ncbi:MAG: hypothetical protein KGM42_11510 [Hyphomicrobiales bacterium]|nr:hypothetical protein [Hyphomicrobiales bacterium]
MTPLFSGLVGALIGGFVTAIVQIWRLYRDELGERTDEVCSLLLELNKQASEYWSLSFADLDDARSREAKLIGLTALLDGLCASLCLKLLKVDADKVQLALSDLLDAVSGGQFSEANRPADLERTRRIPFATAGIIVTLREAHNRTMPLSGFAASYRANRQRSLDLPDKFRG